MPPWRPPYELRSCLTAEIEICLPRASSLNEPYPCPASNHVSAETRSHHLVSAMALRRHASRRSTAAINAEDPTERVEPSA